MRHFVTLVEIHVHLIRVNPGHICELWKDFTRQGFQIAVVGVGRR